MPAKSKTTGPHTYLWKGIPRPLWNAAQKKAAASKPPQDLKWVMIELLQQWVQGNRKVAAKPKKGDPAPVKPEARKPATVIPPASSRTPDLGNAF